MQSLTAFFIMNLLFDVVSSLENLTILENKIRLFYRKTKPKLCAPRCGNDLDVGIMRPHDFTYNI